MTFTDQNFKRLPFVNIRQPVLSLGPICHLSWSPELVKKTCRWKWGALKKKKGSTEYQLFWLKEKQKYFYFSKGPFQKSFFLFSCKFFHGVENNHAQAFSYSPYFTFRVWQLHISPLPSSNHLLKKHLMLYSLHIFPAATIQSKPASPTSRLLHPLLYGSMSKSIHIGLLWD